MAIPAPLSDWLKNVINADEEGPAINGADKFVEWLQAMLSLLTGFWLESPFRLRNK